MTFFFTFIKILAALELYYIINALHAFNYDFCVVFYVFMDKPSR